MCVRYKESCLRQAAVLKGGLTEQMMWIGDFFKKKFLEMPFIREEYRK
jgi:hypothetical protein